MTKSITLHGVLLDIYNIGVLITGPSNIGKSELALGLLERGHRLIADDQILLTKENDNAIWGSCPTALQGFLAIRDLGILSVIKLFGQQVISQQKRLELIIHLTSNHEQHTISTEAILQGVINMQNLMGILIPQQTLLVKPQRNLALLTEISVRSYQLRDTGYNACADLVSKQQQFIDNNP